MKNILLLASCFMGTYYFLKYKEMQELYQCELIDIESQEDLLEKQGVYIDSDGNLQERETSYT
ncbi:hypothetical protein HYE69_09050 [Staphylococcus sp. GSSP0090]|nr:hypothetical protein [Staphylococcus sp. GSSP0090]